MGNSDGRAIQYAPRRAPGLGSGHERSNVSDLKLLDCRLVGAMSFL